MSGRTLRYPLAPSMIELVEMSFPIGAAVRFFESFGTGRRPSSTTAKAPWRAVRPRRCG